MTMANEQSLGGIACVLKLSKYKQREKQLHNPCCVISSNDRYGEPDAEIVNDGYSTYFQQQKGSEQVERLGFSLAGTVEPLLHLLNRFQMI